MFVQRLVTHLRVGHIIADIDPGVVQYRHVKSYKETKNSLGYLIGWEVTTTTEEGVIAVFAFELHDSVMVEVKSK